VRFSSIKADADLPNYFCPELDRGKAGAVVPDEIWWQKQAVHR
jgi:hypothetical protein